MTCKITIELLDTNEGLGIDTTIDNYQITENEFNASVMINGLIHLFSENGLEIFGEALLGKAIERGVEFIAKDSVATYESDPKNLYLM